MMLLRSVVSRESKDGKFSNLPKDGDFANRPTMITDCFFVNEKHERTRNPKLLRHMVLLPTDSTVPSPSAAFVDKTLSRI